MDHVWDGFYTGQIRLSRFTGLIRHNPSKFYNVTFTGTPPLKMIYELFGAQQDHFYKISIDYPNPEVVQILVAGQVS